MRERARSYIVGRMKRLVVLVSVLALGCGSAPEPTDAASLDAAALDAPACAPDEATFRTEILPRIERYCGTCHGARPDFGAPTSLIEHASLLATRPDGQRLVDHIAADRKSVV